jgi:DNA helicase-2/ATP-dependent DNA helicase PcrA
MDPDVKVGGRKFFDREEIKDLLAYLRVIHSLKDTAALLRIINVPGRRLGKERIAVLVTDSETKSRSLWESVQALIGGEIRFTSNDRAMETAIRNFVRTITAARRILVSKDIPSVSDLIDYVREHVSYDDYLRKKFGPDADERIGNLEELKTFASEVDRVADENVLPDIGMVEVQDEGETALERFLGNIALMTDVRDAGEDMVDCVSCL